MRILRVRFIDKDQLPALFGIPSIKLFTKILHTPIIGGKGIFFMDCSPFRPSEGNPPTRSPTSLPAAPSSLYFPIEIPGILAYAKDADEFVRQVCRDRTGWRRD